MVRLNVYFIAMFTCYAPNFESVEGHIAFLCSVMHNLLAGYPISYNAGPSSSIGTSSESDCISRGHEFDLGQTPCILWWRLNMKYFLLSFSSC